MNKNFSRPQASTGSTDGNAVSRRTVARGAAWAAPAVLIASAAPAAAASPTCVDTPATLDFSSNYTRTNATSGTALVPVSGTGQEPVSVTLSSTMSSYTANNQNYRVGTGAWDGLQLQQTRNVGTAPDNASFGQVVTITFDRPVTNLVLPISNFSWPSDNSYGDQVVMLTPGFTYSTGSRVGGQGTVAQPFRNNVQSTSTTYTGPSTTATVTYAGPVQSVSFRYYDKRGTFSAPEQQAIVLQDLRFVATCPSA